MVAKLSQLLGVASAKPEELRKGIDLLQQSVSATRGSLAQLLEVERQLTQSINMLKLYESTLSCMDTAGQPGLSAGAELMSPDDVTRELNISRGTLWRMRKDGRLPQPVRVSQRKLAYRRSEIVEWLGAGGAGG